MREVIRDLYWWGWHVSKRVAIHVEVVVVVIVVDRHIEGTRWLAVVVAADVMWRLRKLMKVDVVRGRW